MFTLSKIIGWLFEPANLIVMLVLLGFALRALRWRRLGAGCIGLGAALLAVGVATPLGEALLFRLEDRIPPPADRAAAIADAQGAIILGGAARSGALIEARGGYQLNESAERVTTIVELRRIRPDLPVLVSGGSGAIDAIPDETSPAEVVGRFLDAMGVGRETVVFERVSRNTYENAVLSATLWGDREGPFLLVTSAAHMPRALGVFRKAGLDVAPFPVDYRADPPSWRWRLIGTRRLEALRGAVKEYVGLAAYYLAGRTDTLFPAQTPPPASGG